MSKNPLVTIYITNYNYSKYIRQSINSAINQSYKNLEIIIVDDCSSDDSIKKINNFKNIKNIKFAFNSKRIGLIKSANKAIKRSKGKYVIRLDGDDILKKDAVKILVKKIRSNKLISMVFPNFDFLHEKQKKIKPYFTRISPNIPNKNHASPFDLAIIASPITLKPMPLSISPKIAYQNHFLLSFFSKIFVVS